MKTESKKLPKSQLEITFELDEGEFKAYFDKALEHLKKHVKVDGFREGKVPAAVAEAQMKPEALLMEAGDIAVRESYMKFIEENNLEAVGNPEIQVKKIAKGSPFEFTAIVTLLPDIDLPDYKEIAKTVKGQDISVSEEEVHHALQHLRRSRAKMTLKNGPAEKGDFVQISYSNPEVNEGKETPDQFVLGEGQLIPGFEDALVGMEAGQEKEFKAKFPEHSPQKNLAGKESTFKASMKNVQKLELAELTDDFAKSLGAFDTLASLEENIKQGLTAEKEEQEKQRRRAEILSQVAEKSKIELPEVLVENEKERLLNDLKDRIAESLKIGFEEYLAGVKKTEQEIKDTYQKEAEKKLRGYLVLRQIGKAEGVRVSPEEIEAETQKALAEYPPSETAKIDISQLKEYTKGVIYNEKIFRILENLPA